MDGRDTPPNSGIDFLRQLEQKIREYGVGQIASIVGRYYAMDRDNRWERIEKAYRAMTHGDAEIKTSDPIAAIQASYHANVTDEFVLPAVITTEAAPGKPAAPRGLIRDDDAVIFYNFRADRAREITKALIEPGFDKIADPARPKNLVFVGMTQYEKSWPWLRYILGAGKARAHPRECFHRAGIQESAPRRNRKICARHLLFQWRHRKTVPRRRAHHGAVAESAHVRFEAGNVRRRHRRCRDSRHRKRRFRRHHHEFRERGHGRPLRATRSDDQGLRNGGRMPGKNFSVAAAARRRVDYHRRSRQRRNDD